MWYGSREMGKYVSSDQAAEILALLVEGKSLAAICRIEGMPKVREVYLHIKEDAAFANDYMRAREDQADTDADAISDIAEQARMGLIEPAAARVAIDAYKWTAGKRKPKKYGDKLAIGGADDLPPIQALDASKLPTDVLRQIMAARSDASDAS